MVGIHARRWRREAATKDAMAILFLATLAGGAILIVLWKKLV